MADLYIYIPGHTFEVDDPVYVSWLSNTYYVADPQTNWFRLSTVDSGSYPDPMVYVQYNGEDTTGGTVQLVADTTYTILTGLDHLEGQVVHAVGDGKDLGSYTVSGGSITLSEEVSKYIVGLKYPLVIESMRLAIPGQPTIQTRVKRIHELSTRYIRGVNGKQGRIIRGVDYMTNMGATYSNTSQDATTPQEPGYDEDGKFKIIHDTAEPFTVLGTVISFDIQETR